MAYRRATLQILLLTAGFLVLVAVSVACVLFVNKAREDSGWVVHTVEVENQTNALCSKSAGPKAGHAATF